MGALGNALADLFEPKDLRPTQEWAPEKVELFPPITRHGMFHLSGSRHFVPIFDALDDERVREVNILKPVRGGGSLIGDVHLLSVMSRRPGPYLNVFQTDPDAKMHFFDRLRPLLSRNKTTAPLMPKRYDWPEIPLGNGYTLYTGGPGLSNLQSKGVRYLRLDECWMYPQGRMAEAEARVGDYLKMEMSKILRISQGGPRDNLPMEECAWKRAYERGAIHEWEVSCSHCSQRYEPVFSGVNPDGSFWGITWDHHRLPNGDWNISRCIESLRFECPHCKKPVVDSPRTKAEWNRTGAYKLTTEDNHKRKSFHFECVIDFPWDELTELWLSACNAERRGDLLPKIQFYQKRRAMFKDEESLLRGGLNLKRVTYEINSTWPDEKARFMDIDRQEEDLFWWSVRAWSAEKSRRLGFGKAYGFAALEEIRKQFNVPARWTSCDSGYLPKGDQGVYAACIRYSWIAVKGDPAYQFVHRRKNGRTVLKSYAELTSGDPESGKAGEGRRYCHLIRFSKSQMNQKVQQLIDAGAWEEPMTGDPEMEKEYAAQMSSRIKKTDYDKRTGETKVYWKESKNDHARDLANQSVLKAILTDLVPDPAEERLTKSEQQQLNNP